MNKVFLGGTCAETTWRDELIPKLQIDDELPSTLDKPIFIQKEVHHRVIKGSGNLIIKLQKLPD